MGWQIASVCSGRWNSTPQAAWGKQQTLFAPQFGGWRSRVKVSAGVASPEAPPLGSQTLSYGTRPGSPPRAPGGSPDLSLAKAKSFAAQKGHGRHRLWPVR